MPESDFFHDKVVLITGGSKGLGLAMAREFGARGANVTIVARHGDEVDEAASMLRYEGMRVDGQVCDVARQDDIDRTLAGVQERHGPIDILVNNAGTVQVGPAEAMSIDDYKAAMDVMLWGTVYPTLKLLPAMRARKQGRIVNITSIGGKVSVPHLLPYDTAKFAAVGFSEGLQAELAPSGVKVVTVVPGLMRTGSFLNAIFRGETRREFKWFSLSSSAPLITISGEDAARRIVKATERGEAELILSLPANFLARFKGLFPGITQRLLGLSRRILPRHTGELGSSTGAELRSAITSKTYARAMTLGDRAAERLQPGHGSRASGVDGSGT